MKVKTSITLEKEVVTAVEAAAREGESRSQVIEQPLCQSLAVRERAAIDNRDRNLINAHADELNQEAVDVLGYQGGNVRRGELYRVARPPAPGPKRFRVFVGSADRR